MDLSEYDSLLSHLAPLQKSADGAVLYAELKAAMVQRDLDPYLMLLLAAMPNLETLIITIPQQGQRIGLQEHHPLERNGPLSRFPDYAGPPNHLALFDDCDRFTARAICRLNESGHLFAQAPLSRLRDVRICRQSVIMAGPISARLVSALMTVPSLRSIKVYRHVHIVGNPEDWLCQPRTSGVKIISLEGFSNKYNDIKQPYSYDAKWVQIMLNSCKALETVCFPGLAVPASGLQWQAFSAHDQTSPRLESQNKCWRLRVPLSAITVPASPSCIELDARYFFRWTRSLWRADWDVPPAVDTVILHARFDDEECLRIGLPVRIEKWLRRVCEAVRYKPHLRFVVDCGTGGYGTVVRSVSESVWLQLATVQSDVQCSFTDRESPVNQATFTAKTWPRREAAGGRRRRSDRTLF